ncbi:MAG: cell division protein FtsQ [Clostridiales bacterium]|nr:cell division protein FtsQ [Clostridiales bacterium]
MKKPKLRTRTKIIFVSLFLLGGITVFQWYNQIVTLEIKGCEYYSEEEIKDNLLTGIAGSNSLLFYLKARYLGLRDLPYIEKVTVKRLNHHSIRIHVYEKALIGCFRYMGEYVYFDKNGIVMSISEDLREGVPCVSGIRFSEFHLYRKLEVEEGDIFKTILDLSQLINRYDLAIEKIHFNSKNEVSLRTDAITIYLGKRDFYDEPIAALSKILPTAITRHLKGIIDMENFKEGDNVILRLQS